jgi:hypothetical protein
VKPTLAVLRPREQTQIHFSVAPNRMREFLIELQGQRAKAKAPVAFLVQSFQLPSEAEDTPGTATSALRESVAGGDAGSTTVAADLLARVWKERETTNRSSISSSKFGIALAAPSIPEGAENGSSSASSSAQVTPSRRTGPQAPHAFGEMSFADTTMSMTQLDANFFSPQISRVHSAPPHIERSDAAASAVDATTGLRGAASNGVAQYQSQQQQQSRAEDAALLAEAQRDLAELRDKYNEVVSQATQLDFERSRLINKVLKNEKDLEVSDCNAINWRLKALLM